MVEQEIKKFTQEFKACYTICIMLISEWMSWFKQSTLRNHNGGSLHVLSSSQPLHPGLIMALDTDGALALFLTNANILSDLVSSILHCSGAHFARLHKYLIFA